jgi:DNA-binding MarR family transcriptional regulator
MSSTPPPELADHTATARLVYQALQDAGPCTQAELRARTLSSPRAVRRALEALQADNLVDEVPSGDARAPLYDVGDR